MYAWSTPSEAAASPNLAPYALKTEIPVLTPYALKTELPSLSGYALTSQIPSLAGYALTSAIPSPASSAPPSVADASAKGAATQYALADHTHASKTRKDRVQSDAAGLITWTFNPAFDVGVVPRVCAIAETTSGVTDVINVQVEGTPTNTGCTLRVTRTQRSVVALIGLTILSIPSSPGATWVHCFAVTS